MHEKLSKNLAWALKRADLDLALAGTGPEYAVSVDFIAKTLIDRSVIDVDWRPGRHNDVSGNLLVWVRPVPADERHLMRKVLVDQGLSEVAAWARGIFEAPPTWRDLPHRRIWWIEDGVVRHRDDDQS